MTTPDFSTYGELELDTPKTPEAPEAPEATPEAPEAPEATPEAPAGWDSLPGGVLELDSDVATVETEAPALPEAPEYLAVNSGNAETDFSAGASVNRETASGALASCAKAIWWIGRNAFSGFEAFKSWESEYLSGDLTVAELSASLQAKGLEYELPSGRRPDGYAGAAIRKVYTRGYTVKTIAKTDRPTGSAGCWIVGHSGMNLDGINTAQDLIGREFGNLAVFVNLSADFQLEIVGGSDSDRVQCLAIFAETFTNKTVPWLKLRDWSRRLVRDEFSGILVQDMDIIYLSEPSTALKYQMGKGLASEIKEIRKRLDTAEKTAQRNGEKGTGSGRLGHRAANSAIVDLQSILERSQAIAAVIGSDAMRPIRVSATELVAFCERFTDVTSIRGSLLELD